MGSKTPPDKLGSGVVSSPNVVRGGARPPKGFPQFSALTMASPDNIILLIVEYNIGGGKTPVNLLAYVPAFKYIMHSCTLWQDGIPAGALPSATLDKLFTRASVTKQYNLVPVNGRRRFAAGYKIRFPGSPNRDLIA